MKKTILSIGILAGMMLAATSTAIWSMGDPHPTSDQIQAQQTARITEEAARAVPIPSIQNFQQKRDLKSLYELLDQPNYATRSYVQVPMTGKLIYICDSVSYGIPASMQFSNPEKVGWFGSNGSGHWDKLPQAEPNGLFPPQGLSATYTKCVNPKTKEVEAGYLEPNLIVFPTDLSCLLPWTKDAMYAPACN